MFDLEAALRQFGREFLSGLNVVLDQQNLGHLEYLGHRLI
jgi:hypothetical protein